MNSKTLLWEAGGGWKAWTRASLESLAFIVLLSLAIRYVFRVRAECRWFTLHACVNFAITLTAFPDLYLMAANPTLMLTDLTICSLYPLALNQMLHLYHTALYFNELRYMDYLHHGVMTFVAVPLIFLQTATPLINASHVFVTGLPGGCSYAMLALVKCGRMSRGAEKRWSARLNLWMRAPGLVVICAYGHIQSSFLNATLAPVPLWQRIALYMSLAIYCWNGLYFASTIISSDAIFHHRRAKEVQVKDQREDQGPEDEDDLKKRN
jgi:hypothetical protein